MKGTNTLILNEETVKSALAEYFGKRFVNMNFDVTSVYPRKDGGCDLFEVTIVEKTEDR